MLSLSQMQRQQGLEVSDAQIAALNTPALVPQQSPQWSPRSATAAASMPLLSLDAQPDSSSDSAAAATAAAAAAVAAGNEASSLLQSRYDTMAMYQRYQCARRVPLVKWFWLSCRTAVASDTVKYALCQIACSIHRQTSQY
jgi:hypothetical protein